MNAPFRPGAATDWVRPRTRRLSVALGVTRSHAVTAFLVLAAVAVAALYAVHTWNASRLIDGVRWFWLDDDMMISMRYARNLAEGFGLVFNPGERVEGYTNFAWVIVMALVHLLPLTDQLMAIALRCVSAAVCVGAFVVAAQLVRALEPRLTAITVPAVLLLMLGCVDVMFWAVSGFETILITLLHLLVVWGALSGRTFSPVTLVALALLPIVRSDGMVTWLGDAALLLWMASDRRRMLALLAVTLLPFAAHLSFRLFYYGDLLPNTYYLKLDGLEDRFFRGLAYVRGFAERYAIVIVLAAAAAVALWKQDKRAVALATTMLPATAYAWYVGGDAFGSFRFFAHVVPELFIWSAIGAVALVTWPAARAAWLLAPLAVLSLPRLLDPANQVVAVGGNGDPYHQVIVAAQLLGNAAPDASVAVIPAGIVPYFTRLYSVDLLGKTDAYIAHLPPRAGALNGHGKLDPEYSFGKEPDYVVSVRPDSYSTGLTAGTASGAHGYIDAILGSPEFQSLFKPNPVPDPYLLNHTAVYIRTGSPEIAKLKTWWGVYLDQ